MQISIQTSSIAGALLRGIAVGGLLIAFLWAIGVPLNWTIALILFAVGTSSAVYFYDGSLRDRPRLVSDSDILMRNVQWDFSLDAPRDFDRFIEQVKSEQTDPSTWDPEQIIPDCGPLKVLVIQYDTDADPEQILTLDPPPDGVWSHGRILHSLHHRLRDQKLLGHATFFEGLIRRQRNRFQLVLGS